MKFTDIFIHRPVLASVVSLLILVIGLRAIAALEVRQFPETQNTVVTVTTTYPGASADLVKGFITTPLQQAVAEADGIDFLVSTSTQGRSVIEANMVLNHDANAAVAEIQAKVASQRNVLPAEADDPVIDSVTGDVTALMYLAFYSDTMSPSQITDYLLRVVQPRLQAVPGVAKAGLIGNKTFAMRIWLQPERMAALGVTAADVRAALQANNYLAGIGETRGTYVTIDLGATTDIASERDFERLVVRDDGDVLVRISDIGEARMGAEDYDSTSWYKGKTASYIGIEPTPGANPLQVAARVHIAMDEIRAGLPPGLNAHIPYDASVYINDSIDEVFKTLAEAVMIVLVVIFLSLGSMRAALVPAVAVPLSLIGGAFLMLLMGFSINLLTLLSIVLAIGLVVDDAIVVVENVHRHIENGEDRTTAAIKGARELALPIIAMTTTLVAVYAPIGFMGGLVGTLFTEFAFTLAGAVLVSGIVALTLSPMLSGKVLKASGEQGRFEQTVEHFFNRLSGLYRKALHGSLEALPATLLFAAVILGSIYFLFTASQDELAPTEDQSILFFQALGPQTATLDYNEAYTRHIVEQFEAVPEYHESFYLLGFGGDNRTVFGGFKMPPPSERERSQMQVMPEVQAGLNRVAGFQTAVFPRPSLPAAGRGLPLQFVITSPGGDYDQLVTIADELIGRGMQSGKFAFLRKSIEYTRPRTTVVVDRDLAGDLGISMQDVGGAAGRQLRKPFQPGRAQLQGHPAGCTAVPPRQRHAGRLPRPHRQRRTGANVHHHLLREQRRTQQAQPVPAAQRPHRRGRGRTGHDPGRGTGVPRNGGARAVPARLRLGLCRRVAPVRPAGQRADHHLFHVHPGDLPGAGRAVRELARPGDHPGIGANVDRRCAGVPLPGLRHGEHLHPGGPDNPDRADRQERHPDRGIREPAAAAGRPRQACGGGARGNHTPAADPHDHRIHDGCHDTAAARQRTGSSQPLSHRPGDRHRAGHRHAVYPVRGPGRVSAAGTVARGGPGRRGRPPD